MDNLEAPKSEAKTFNRPLLAGYSIVHKSRLLHVSGWDIRQTENSKYTVRFSVKFGFNQLFEAIKTGLRAWHQLRSLLAPNDVKITRWRRPYLGYFGFTFVQLEEAEAGCASFYTVSDINLNTSQVKQYCKGFREHTGAASLGKKY